MVNASLEMLIVETTVPACNLMYDMKTGRITEITMEEL